MLIKFSIRNFKTFKERATISMVASNYDKHTREEDNVIEDSKFQLRVLKSAVIYGANASGKSKFLEALMFMKYFVITSSRESQKGDPIEVEPFKLNAASESDSSEFEVIFLYNEIVYRYGFEVDKHKVCSEWLYYKPKTKEIEVFYRDFQKFETHQKNFRKGSTIIKEGLVRDNALLISVAAQFNDTASVRVIEWFKGLKTISGLREEGYEGFTVSEIMEPTKKQKILELLTKADLGIQDIEPEKLDTGKLPKDMPKELKEVILKQSKEDGAEFFSDISTLHKKYDEHKKMVGSVVFSMRDDESSGTKKFFALTGPILDVLDNGYTLVVDELDSKVHPNLVCKIVSLFNSKHQNPRNAQLIFNTHDTNLLDSGLFRRDQVWFTEKNKYGEARLYSLGDFKSDEVRKKEAFEDNYIRGKYGAVPYLDLFENFISDKNSMLK